MDYYLVRENSVKRLIDEHDKYGKIIVALDYDDTIYDFHKRGRTYNKVINILKQLEDDIRIVLFSASPKSRYPEMLGYCKKLGLNIEGINENLKGIDMPSEGKIYYNILLDDRAGLDSTYYTLAMLSSYLKMKNNMQSQGVAQ